VRTLIYFRTPISRALARFKRKHPKLYKKWFRFRWVDVGRDVTPKIDFHGIRVVYPQTDAALKWLRSRDPVQRNRTVFITSLVSVPNEKEVERAKEWLREEGYRIRKTSNHIYDLYV